MKRNPYARALRIHRPKVVPDKREKTYREHLQDVLIEGVPEWAEELLARLK